jgi:hypothetical protein
MKTITETTTKLLPPQWEVNEEVVAAEGRFYFWQTYDGQYKLMPERHYPGFIVDEGTAKALVALLGYAPNGSESAPNIVLRATRVP